MPINMIFVCDFIEKARQLPVAADVTIGRHFKTKAFAGGLVVKNG